MKIGRKMHNQLRDLPILFFLTTKIFQKFQSGKFFWSKQKLRIL
jgi:hypothetical protein